MVRAKFRVMEVSQMHNGQVTILRLLPVYGKPPKGSALHEEPDACEENRRFWEATPSGEARLTYQGFEQIPFRIGQCVFFDMVESPEGEWKLESVTSSSCMTVKFHRSWKDEFFRSGSLEMNIVNQEAWTSFQGKHQTSWSVAVHSA